MPLYLLTLFAKGDQANLSKAERNELAGLFKLLVQGSTMQCGWRDIVAFARSRNVAWSHRSERSLPSR